MKYGSVCSGIEAATVAWHVLGWRAAWFSEIEAFPSAALAHHYPDVANLGDMTRIARRILSNEVEAPDVLVGGTPCQAFSVAGLRNSLADERGNLSLRYVELADAIDHVRVSRGDQPAVIVWENVPGVLSTKDNAFGCFLAGLAGEDEPLQPPGKRWANAGAVYGPRRAIAWRTLDAQYFGLAQRRRRVFVVASARNGFDPAPLLFEWSGLRRDSSPVRETGQSAARTITASAGHHGYGSPRDGVSENLIPEISLCLDAGGMGRIDSESETMIPVAFDSRQDCVSSSEVFGSLGSSSPQAQAVAFAQNSRDEVRLEAGDGSRTGTLSTGGGKPGQGVPMVAFAIQERAQHPELNAGPGGKGYHEEIAYTLEARNKVQSVAKHAVRRLTPRECERLQGFPDDYTMIPWRNKSPSDCPDGPRYKALGNSMAVPVMRWIGQRIEEAL